MFVSAADVAFEAYDVIIAGSGPAGATVARQLATLGKKSLILETGPLEYDSDLQDAYSKVYGSGHYGSDHWPQHWVRSFGGTSLVWSGWCAPLSARNLASWPIDADDLNPYYPPAAAALKRSESFLTYQRPFVTGFALRPYSNEDPLRVAEEYAQEFSTGALIDVALETSLTGLQANEARSRVTGISLFSPTHGPRQVTLGASQQLVLAAGGLGNAHILLASHEDGAVAVGNEQDQVGRYLMEHPHFFDCARMVVASDLTPAALPEDFGEANPAIVPDDTLFERYGRLDAALEIVEAALNPDDNVEQYVVHRLGGAAKSYDITVRSEMPPDPENRVQLAENRDPAGMPRLRASCVISGTAMRAVENHLRQLGATLMREGKGRLRIDNDVIYREPLGGGHTMGTTRMGDDPKTSVVDRNCRVHGYSNLSIAGSSVFTTGGYANPTLTIVALALRLADHLGET